MSCPFCDLIAHPDDPHVVAINSDTAVLLDHAPVFLGHALVVPRTHVEHLLVAPPDLAALVMTDTQATARAMMEAYQAEGVLTLANTIMSQSVPHLHVHVIPRRRGDGLRGFLWPRQRYGSSAVLAEYRDRLRHALATDESVTRTRQ
jgi:histidine triad (HIT) family protein